MRFKFGRLFPFIVAFAFAFSAIALADPSPIPSFDPTQTVSTDAFIGALFSSLGGLKGAGVLGGAVILTQLAMKFSLTKWGDFEGRYKLGIVLGLSWIAGTLGLMATAHLSFVAALLHSTSLAAFQVFGNELINEFGTRSTSSPPPTTQAGSASAAQPPA